MVHLELDTDESVELLYILRNAETRLQREIAHTDHREFKNLLRVRETHVTHILERLQEQVGDKPV
jgi:hypothetical protein